MTYFDLSSPCTFIQNSNTNCFPISSMNSANADSPDMLSSISISENTGALMLAISSCGKYPIDSRLLSDSSLSSNSLFAPLSEDPYDCEGTINIGGFSRLFVPLLQQSSPFLPSFGAYEPVYVPLSTRQVFYPKDYSATMDR
ncbi:hypothetical protein AX774_g4693 [Zancudomyces culisetae]|uniref:Uncharacterized protein n=1 Tax=Zancudomyces culisetae TaxID=1213189 RepID=A0A1R1PLJ4_ZANCU|nr:hypothetical protein AX774_g4693 [Zancudomyces culisetae]|eukprot:OMH81840.1 hypothetical protein AX774_g4693 [Zancudomyces culisetae]